MLRVLGVSKNDLPLLIDSFEAEDALYGLVPWLPGANQCQLVALAFESWLRERGIRAVVETA